MATRGGMRNRRLPLRLLPAFDDGAMAAAMRYARSIWERESAALRDRILALPTERRVRAIDHEATRAALVPAHREAIVASLTPPPAPPPPPPPPAPPPQPSWEQQLREREAAEQRRYQQQKLAEERKRAEWRARDAAERAEARRIDLWQRLTTWCFVPAAALLPSVILAVLDGWSPLQIAAAALEAILAPGISTGAALLGVIGSVGCAWWARREPLAGLPFVVGFAILTGMLVATSPRAMPIYTVQARVIATDGRSMTGTLVRVDPGNDVEVLVGNGQFHRGDWLRFKSDPVAYFR